MSTQVFTQADFPALERRELTQEIYKILQFTVMHKGVTTTYGYHPEWSPEKIQANEATIQNGRPMGNFEGRVALPKFAYTYQSVETMMKWFAYRMGIGALGGDWVLCTSEQPSTHYVYVSDAAEQEAADNINNPEYKPPAAFADLKYKNEVVFYHKAHLETGCSRTYAACLVMYWALLWKQENGGLIDIKKCV